MAGLNRHGLGLVGSWCHFFREDWAQALYYDRFRELVLALRTRLKSDDSAREVTC